MDHNVGRHVRGQLDRGSRRYGGFVVVLEKILRRQCPFFVFDFFYYLPAIIRCFERLRPRRIVPSASGSYIG
jgi:hypothetical protein